MNKPTIKEAIQALSLDNDGSTVSLALLEESDPVAIVENVAKVLSASASVLAMAPEALETLGTAKNGNSALYLMVQSLEHALHVASRLVKEERSDRGSRSEAEPVPTSQRTEAIDKLFSEMSHEVSKAKNAWDMCQLLDFGVPRPEEKEWLSDPDSAKDDLMANIGAHLKTAQAAYEKALPLMS